MANKKHFSEMTSKEKFEHFYYSSYRHSNFNMEDYISSFDDEFLDMCLANPYNSRFRWFFQEKGYDITDFFNKLGAGSEKMNSQQEKLLKVLILTGSEQSINLQRGLSSEDKDKITDFVINNYNESNRKGGLLSTFSFTLTFDTFKKLVENIPTLSEKDIKQFLSSVLSTENGDDYSDKNITILLNQPEIREYLIKNMDASDFYYVANKYSLGDDAVLERQRHNIEILKNAKNMSFDTVKNALSDLMFRTNYKNAILDIETLIDYADSSEKYKQHIDELYYYLNMVKGVFEQEKEPENYEKYIGKVIESLISSVDKLKTQGIDFYQLMQKEKIIAKSIFYSQMENAMLETKNKIFDGADVNYIEHNGHKIPVYTVAKQTENQKDFYLLVHTQDVRGNTPEEAKQGYYDLRCNRSTNCCSVVSDKHLSVFGNTGVVFGYFGFHGSELLSATSSDGQTGQRAIAHRKDRMVYKQNYVTNDDFVANSGDSHNELAFSSTSIDEHGVLKPDYVISFTETPSEKTLLAASAFGVPIMYINPELYKEQDRTKGTRAKEYLYPVFAEPKTREQMQSEMN